MIRNLAIDIEKIDIVYAGTEAPIEPPSAELNRFRKEQGLSGITILSAGHLGAVKGHADAIEAFAHARKTLPSIHLYIAGTGSAEEIAIIERAIQEQALGDCVHLLGQVRNLHDWYSASDIFLLASREEGFGLVFIEAGAYALPVVATNVGGIPDIVVDGDTGFLCRPRDAECLSRHILTLSGDAELRKRLGAAARARIARMFSPTAQMDSLLASYEAAGL